MAGSPGGKAPGRVPLVRSGITTHRRNGFDTYHMLNYSGQPQRCTRRGVRVEAISALNQRALTKHLAQPIPCTRVLKDGACQGITFPRRRIGHKLQMSRVIHRMSDGKLYDSSRRNPKVLIPSAWFQHCTPCHRKGPHGLTSRVSCEALPENTLRSSGIAWPDRGFVRDVCRKLIGCCSHQT